MPRRRCSPETWAAWSLSSPLAVVWALAHSAPAPAPAATPASVPPACFRNRLRLDPLESMNASRDAEFSILGFTLARMRRPTNSVVSSEMGKVSTGGSIDAVQQSRYSAAWSQDESTGRRTEELPRLPPAEGRDARQIPQPNQSEPPLAPRSSESLPRAQFNLNPLRMKLQ